MDPGQAQGRGSVHGQDRSDRRRPPEFPRQRAPHVGSGRLRGRRGGRGRRCRCGRRPAAASGVGAAGCAVTGYRRVRGGEEPARIQRPPAGRAHVQPRFDRPGRRDRGQRRARVHPERRVDGERVRRAVGMKYSRRAVVGVSVAAGLLGVGSVALILSSPQTHAEGTFALRGVYAAFLLLIGWGFAGTGLYAWSRRPANAIGPLMTATGLAWLLRGLGVSDNSVLFSIGELAAPAAFALLAHLLLAFPSGRLQTSAQRRLAALAYANATVLQVAAFVVTDTTAPDAGCDGCPPNPILIFSSSSLAGLVILLQLICSFVLLIGLVLTMLRRWRRATAGQRRSLSPVLSAGAFTLLFLASALVAGTVGAAAAADAALIVALTSFACVPFAFLLGLLRSRLGQAEAVSLVVGKLGANAGRSALRDTLAQALGDPRLELAYWVPEISSYVESDGRPVVLPAPGSGRVATRISHGGDPVAAVIHGASLEDDADLVQAVGAAVTLTLRSERLDAELQVRVAELRASRGRIVHQADEQRRRIERDLHDGAQQRLMALGINLRLARERVDHAPRAGARRRRPGRGRRADRRVAAGAERSDRRATRAGARHPPSRADRARP